MLLTTSAAARILDESENTVRARERRGELPAIRTSTGMRLFYSEVVAKLAEKRRQRALHKPEAAECL